MMTTMKSFLAKILI